MATPARYTGERDDWMIVRREGTRLVLITQPRHAALAGQIMSRCPVLAAHPRRSSLLRAVHEHDGGWAIEDARPLVSRETGEVLDFIHAPMEVRQGVWPRAVALLDDDPWAALLVAEHAISVYARLHDNPEWEPFFARMRSLRGELLARTGGSLLDLVEDYVFVRLGDLISLMFCTGSEELNQIAGYHVSKHGDAIRVEPGVFDEEIPFEVEGVAIPARPFTSDSDLHAAIAEGELLTLKGSVR